MARLKKKGSTSASPYQKYNKVAYQYAYKNCGHKTLTLQSAPQWKGKVCTVCNIIVETFDANTR